MEKQNISIKIGSVNISEKKGTVKKPVEKAELTNEGIKGDAHSGKWHRQISLMSVESLRRFEEVAGRRINYGEFAENITLEGIDLTRVGILDRFKGDQVEFEVTQIGKKCHGDTCAIFREVGKCAMPKEGIFCRVIKTGEIKPGLELKYAPKIFRLLVITLSDRAYRGDYEDRSGKVIEEEMQGFFEDNVRRFHIERQVIPDNSNELMKWLQKASDNSFDIVITTGGTGIGSRDITPETMQGFIDKELPGIMEMVRVKYGKDNPNALLSRAVAGIKGKTLLYALPGSINAVKEYLEVVIPTLQHSLYMLHDLDMHG
ncbi:MAG: molybdenum cofactor synthesis domain-containing protein [Bacteroidales bacterium]